MRPFKLIMVPKVSLFRRLVLRSLILACAPALWFSASAQSARVALNTRATQTPLAAQDDGVLPVTQRLSLTLTLAQTPDRAAALDSFLSSLTTSSSPSYHQWLTPTQFAVAYGAYTGPACHCYRLGAGSGIVPRRGFPVQQPHQHIRHLSPAFRGIWYGATRLHARGRNLTSLTSARPRCPRTRRRCSHPSKVSTICPPQPLRLRPARPLRPLSTPSRSAHLWTPTPRLCSRSHPPSAPPTCPHRKWLPTRLCSARPPPRASPRSAREPAPLALSPPP